MPSSCSDLPPFILTCRHVMCQVQHTVFQPTRLRSFIRLPKSRVGSGFALPVLLNVRILPAIGLCLAPGAAVVHAGDLQCVFIAEVVPVHFVAGHHLGHHILFEHVAVCQCDRALYTTALVFASRDVSFPLSAGLTFSRPLIHCCSNSHKLPIISEDI